VDLEITVPRTSFAVLSLLALLLPAAPAAADEPPAPPAAEAGAPRAPAAPATPALLGRDFRAIGFVGPFGDTTDGRVGIARGALALLRVALLEVGVLGQGGRESPGYGFASAAVLAGLGVQAGSGLRADVLAQLGFDRYTGVGSGSLGAPPGASALLPLLGGRLGLSYHFLKSARVHPEIGVWGVLEGDVGRPTIGYTCAAGHCGPFGEGPVALSETVGTRRVSALLSLGLAFDLR
jgi:hypothetical protein